MDLVDSDGLESLSMRNLADRLNVQAMSLYNHVKNKDDIIDELVDQVLGEVIQNHQPKGASWRDFMRSRSLSLYQVLTNHPWAVIASISRISVGPNRLRLIETTLSVLSDCGVSLVLADHVLNAVDSFIYGFVLHEMHMPIQRDDYSSAAEEYLPTIDTTQYPQFSRLAQDVITGTYDGINHVEFGLDLLLQALETKIAMSDA